MVLLKLVTKSTYLTPFINLHSTMVLLKSTRKFNKIMLDKSTFHYGSIKIVRMEYSTAMLTYLHSTMVLLKSSKFSTVLLNIVTSTFHYGSIKMHQIMAEHYLVIIDLHSTMVLLKLILFVLSN